ncbi:MAG TPA: hypothetical protein PKC81_02530 [Sphingorhabdus sp.]|jgi:hypothetical protein|nr:MAG: hypothetical protein E6R00_01415 [Gammaproteobacteria bacterium]HMT40489.1 hypothetical protein [Sphingorhabdus sp.]
MLMIDPNAADAKLRLSGFLVANQFLATAATLRRAFDLGHDDVLIVLTVALGNVQRMLRTPDAQGLAASTALVEQDRIIPVSRRAVARATGLSRETVRRRINSLLLCGKLLEWEDGVRTARRLILSPQIRESIHEMLELTAGTCRALQREGIIIAD